MLQTFHPSCHVDVLTSCHVIPANHIQQHCTMRTSDQKQNKGLDTESGVQQPLSLSPLLSSLFSLSFGRGMKGPRAGSRQKQHSTAVRITVIIFTIMTTERKSNCSQLSVKPTTKMSNYSQLSVSLLTLSLSLLNQLATLRPLHPPLVEEEMPPQVGRPPARVDGAHGSLRPVTNRDQLEPVSRTVLYWRCFDSSLHIVAFRLNSKSEWCTPSGTA